MNQPLDQSHLDTLRRVFGDRMLEQEPLAPYTSLRVGGPADALIKAGSADELALGARTAWAAGIPFRVIGGGCNLLVSDNGYRGLIILNRARQVTLMVDGDRPRLRAESGATLAVAARKAIKAGWGGLEWAATVPGSVGGAVINNAGAFGGNMQGDLLMAEILQQGRPVEAWTSEDMAYAYRKSALKRNPGSVVLAAELELRPSTPQACKEKVQSFMAKRKRSQPPGASMGSTFMNPPGDFAGRLLEEAGLKGESVGPVQVSTLHANFVINSGGGRAQEVLALIRRMRSMVLERSGVTLDLEIELFGDWEQGALEGLEEKVGS